MDVRAFALVPDSALAAVSAAVAQSVDAWSRDWGVAAPAVTCRRAWQQADATPAWRSQAVLDGAGAWFGWQDDACAQLQRVLFAPDRSYGPQGGTAQVAAAGAVAAFDALVAVLAQAALGPGVASSPADGVSADALRAGSGAVLVEVRIERCALWLMLDHAAVRRVAPPVAAIGTALAPVDIAALLADHPVRLPVEAGRAQASLGSLLALAPGDVIRLDTLADRPLAATAPDGTALLRGYLGTHEHHLALDVVAGGSSSGDHA